MVNIVASRQGRLSMAIALGIMLLTYFINNLSFPLGGEKSLLLKFEAVRNYLCPRENKVVDSVLFVNVTYDRVLVPVTDDNGLPVGCRQITDRGKLLRLLKQLKKQNNYKYILLDVFFGENTPTDYDEQLYATIASMPRIAIPCHGNEKLADGRLKAKAGYADYTATFEETSFVKYPFWTNSQKALPVKMYEELTGRKLTRFGQISLDGMDYGGIYLDGWRLMPMSVVLTFDVWASTTYADDGQKIWYNLGMDLLNDGIPEQGIEGYGLLYSEPTLTKNKYIVIGSFEGDDMHNTFFEKTTSGAIINFNAFLALMKGHHIVNPLFLIVLFVMFSFMSYLILCNKSFPSLVSFGDSGGKWQFAKWALSTFVTFTLVVSILCLLMYVVFHESYHILITSMIFWSLQAAMQIRNTPMHMWNNVQILKYIKKQLKRFKLWIGRKKRQ